MKPTLLIAFTLGLYALSPAPINSRPPDFKPTPERTEQQLSEEQRLQRVQSEVGAVPLDTEPNHAEYARDDASAAETVAAASAAQSNLVEATEDAAKSSAKPKAGRNFFWGLALLVIGACSALGFRAWANRAVPMPVHPKSPKW